MNLSTAKRCVQTVSGVFMIYLLSSCTANLTDKPSATDKWEETNRKVLKFNDDVDSLVLKPMAKAYLWSTPEFIDTSVTNFFNNLDDIGTAFNNFLQLKLLAGGSDLARFVVNTTVGIAGFIDVGSELNLPKHEEDFDQTLGVWGVPMEPYLVLPFIGPSSPRGIIGLVGDAIFNPLTYTFLLSGGAVSVASMGSGVLDATDTRAGLLTSEKIINEAAIDRYQFIKSTYQQRRRYLVNDGNLPEEDSEFLLDEEFNKPPKP